MATIGDLISDVELRLTGGSVSDDFQVDRRQIRFWIDTERARLIEESDKSGGMQELADFIRLYECVDINKVKSPCLSGCGSERYEVELPVSVSNIKNDLGVYRVETISGVTIRRIRLSEVSRIKNMRFSSPSRSRIVYYRLNNSSGKSVLNIEGGTDSFKNNGKVNLYLIPEDTSSFDESEEYPINASLIPVLLERVEQIGRRELPIEQDLENDGK